MTNLNSKFLNLICRIQYDGPDPKNSVHLDETWYLEDSEVTNGESDVKIVVRIQSFSQIQTIFHFDSPSSISEL